MPQHQTHRGKNPQDDALFADATAPVLRAAVQDLSYLLTRRYSEPAALTLVGDHYQLAARQRHAVLRGACSDLSLARRRAAEVDAAHVGDAALVVDGYNVLIGAESALSGGMLFRCRDGCIRDIASVHGSYRHVEETRPALLRLGMTLQALAVGHVLWYLDAPIGNSGRLRELMLELATAHGWPWEVELERNPDRLIIAHGAIAVTTDGMILDGARAWFNLAPVLIAGLNPAPRIVDLRTPDCFVPPCQQQ